MGGGWHEVNPAHGLRAMTGTREACKPATLSGRRRDIPTLTNRDLEPLP